jgi:hypothetical protein
MYSTTTVPLRRSTDPGAGRCPVMTYLPAHVYALNGGPSGSAVASVIMCAAHR